MSRRPRVQRGSSQPRLGSVKNRPASKRARNAKGRSTVELEPPYRLSPPSVPSMVLSQTLRIPGFHPVDPNTPEEVLTTLNMANGYYEPSCVRSEYSRRRNFFTDLSKDELHSVKVDILECLHEIEWRRGPLVSTTPQRDHTAEQSSRKASFPVQVAAKPEQKAKWMKDLAGELIPIRMRSHTPLRELVSIGVPHAHGRHLLEALAEEQAPLLRATWYIKVAHLNRDFRRKGTGRASGWKNKGIDEAWPNTFTSYLKEKLREMANPGNDANVGRLADKYQYISRLLNWLYCEHLVDRRSVLSSLVSSLLEYDKVDRDAMLLATTMQYLEDVCEFPDLVLALLKYCYAVRTSYEHYQGVYPSPNPSPGGVSDLRRLRRSNSVTKGMTFGQNVSFRLKHLRVCNVLDRLMQHDPVAVVSFSEWGVVQVFPTCPPPSTWRAGAQRTAWDSSASGEEPVPWKICQHMVAHGLKEFSTLDRLVPTTLSLRASVVQHLDRFGSMVHQSVESLYDSLFPPNVEASALQETIDLLCEWVLQGTTSQASTSDGDPSGTTRGAKRRRCSPMAMQEDGREDGGVVELARLRALAVAATMRRFVRYHPMSGRRAVVQEAALKALTQPRAAAQLGGLVFLFGELFRHKVVLHEDYARGLIARGLLEESSSGPVVNKDAERLHCRACLERLPVYGRLRAHTQRRVGLWGLNPRLHQADKLNGAQLKSRLLTFLNHGDGCVFKLRAKDEELLAESSCATTPVAAGDVDGASQVVASSHRYHIALLNQWALKQFQKGLSGEALVTAGNLSAMVALLEATQDSFGLATIIRALLEAHARCPDLAERAAELLKSALPQIEAMGLVVPMLSALWKSRVNVKGAGQLYAELCGFHWNSPKVQASVEASDSKEYLEMGEFHAIFVSAQNAHSGTLEGSEPKDGGGRRGLIVRVPDVSAETTVEEAESQLCSVLMHTSIWSVKQDSEHIKDLLTRCTREMSGQGEREKWSLVGRQVLLRVVQDPEEAAALFARLLTQLEPALALHILQDVLLRPLQTQEGLLSGECGLEEVFRKSLLPNSHSEPDDGASGVLAGKRKRDSPDSPPPQLSNSFAQEGKVYSGVAELLAPVLARHAGDGPWVHAVLDGLLPLLETLIDGQKTHDACAFILRGSSALHPASAEDEGAGRPLEVVAPEPSIGRDAYRVVRLQRVVRFFLQLLAPMANSGLLREIPSASSSYDKLVHALFRLLPLGFVSGVPSIEAGVFEVVLWTLRKLLYGVHSPEDELQRQMSGSAPTSKREKHRAADRTLADTSTIIPQDLRRKLLKVYKKEILPTLPSVQQRKLESVIPLFLRPAKKTLQILPDVQLNPWAILEDYHDGILTREKLGSSKTVPRSMLRYACMVFPEQHTSETSEQPFFADPSLSS